MNYRDKQSFVRAQLEMAFNTIKATNPRFSSRAFARKIGVSIGMFSEFMAGKRNVSEKKMRKILEGLTLDKQEWIKFNSLPVKNDKKFRISGEDQGDSDFRNVSRTTSHDGASLFFSIDEKTHKKIVEIIENFQVKLAKNVDRLSTSENKFKQYEFSYSLKEVDPGNS